MAAKPASRSLKLSAQLPAVASLCRRSPCRPAGAPRAITLTFLSYAPAGSVIARLAGIWFYLAKLAWPPADLAFIHPHRDRRV